MYETFSKLTIKTPRRSGIFIVNFEHISYLYLVFLLLPLSIYLFVGFEYNFEHVLTAY